jgi:fatty acid amide hydrolase
MSELFSLSATEQLALLRAGKVSSVELTNAHLARIDRFDARLRSFTEVLHATAIESAARADRDRARGEDRPLLGLPVSVKESLDMAGSASTMGVPSRRGVIAKQDAGIVRALREAGAVILGRTNVSQLLIFHESRNPLFGQTANPWSPAHGPGGSSGGEGAAIGAGLSPLGVGTDIGGSIRVPAHFCGIAGLKPTLDRWTNRGSNTAMAGQETVRGQCGPMARTVDDLVLAMGALDPIAQSAIDARVPPLPFAPLAPTALSKLRVGVFVDDGMIPASAALLRAIGTASEALADAGVEVVPFTVPDAPEAIWRYFAVMSSDGGAIVDRALTPAEMDPVLLALRRVAKMPDGMRHAASKVAEVMGERRVARLLDVIGKKPVDELWGLTAAIRAYRFQVTEAMGDARIDAVLGVAHSTPALPHLGAKDFALAGSGSMLWNLLQFPAGVVPVTRVRSSETSRSGKGDRLEKLAAKVDAQSSGLPVGVQIAGKPWREDLVLALMSAIETRVRPHPEFPLTPVEP